MHETCCAADCVRRIPHVRALGLTAILAIAGCTAEPGPVSPAAPPPAVRSAPLTALPVTLPVRQRSTTVVPGSADKLSLTIDDITRGQVQVSLSVADGAVVLGPTSLQPGDGRDFSWDGFRYRITLDRLDNQLVGDDLATFILAEGAAVAPQLTEAEKIERLIAAVVALDGAVFVRNGAEHTPAEAAEHLRQKLQAAGEANLTAREFIDRLASQSSLSGEPYTLRWPDGKTTTAREFFTAKLAEIEGQAQ